MGGCVGGNGEEDQLLKGMKFLFGVMKSSKIACNEAWTIH